MNTTTETSAEALEAAEQIHKYCSSNIEAQDENGEECEPYLRITPLHLAALIDAAFAKRLANAPTMPPRAQESGGGAETEGTGFKFEVGQKVRLKDFCGSHTTHATISAPFRNTTRNVYRVRIQSPSFYQEIFTEVFRAEDELEAV